MTKVALVGAGQVSLGLLHELAEKIKRRTKVDITEIDIFSIHQLMGAGLPYNPDSTDPEHLFNVATNLITAPHREDFFQYISSHKREIEENCVRIFAARFREKFHKRFGDEDENSEPNLKEKEALREHYKSLWNSFKTRYLNLDKAASYHPRILYGMYANHLFEESIRVISDAGIVVKCHPSTEVKSLVRDKVSGELEIGFCGDAKEGSKKFDHAIIATGRAFVKGEISADPYISEIWPINNLKKKLEAIVDEEIAKRKKSGSADRIIKIGIEGVGPSAIDVLKTIFRDGIFEQDAKGNIRFIPNDEEGYEIHVDLLSRSGTMQSVRGKSPWNQIPMVGFSKDLAIDQKLILRLSQEQDNRIYLWQIMLLMARTIEVAYRINGKDDSANVARDFVKLIIRNTPNKLGDMTDAELDKKLDQITGAPFFQLQEMQKVFGLELGSANYDVIMQEFQETFLSAEPFDQIKSNLALAEKGDLGKGFLLIRDIFVQFDSLSLSHYLDDEERALLLNSQLSRIINSFIGAIPIQSAKELMALQESGVLDIKVLGASGKVPEIRGDKVVVTTEEGEELEYAAVVNCRGYEFDLRRNPSPLYRSMIAGGIVELDSCGIVKKTDELHVKGVLNIDFADDIAGLNGAFKRGGRITESFLSQTMAMSGFQASRVVGEGSKQFQLLEV